MSGVRIPLRPFCEFKEPSSSGTFRYSLGFLRYGANLRPLVRLRFGLFWVGMSHDLIRPLCGFCIVIACDHAVKLFAEIFRVTKPLIHDVRLLPLQSIANCRRSKIVEQLGPRVYASTLQSLLERSGIVFVSQASSAPTAPRRIRHRNIETMEPV